MEIEAFEYIFGESNYVTIYHPQHQNGSDGIWYGYLSGNGEGGGSECDSLQEGNGIGHGIVGSALLSMYGNKTGNGNGRGV